MTFPDESDQQLTGLWQQYHDACATPDLSVEFLPKLWARIDARRSFSLRLGLFARGFVTAGACLCLLFATLLVQTQAGHGVTSGYLDMMAEAQASQDLTATDVGEAASPREGR